MRRSAAPSQKKRPFPDDGGQGSQQKGFKPVILGSQKENNGAATNIAAVAVKRRLGVTGFKPPAIVSKNIGSVNHSAPAIPAPATKQQSQQTPNLSAVTAMDCSDTPQEVAEESEIEDEPPAKPAPAPQPMRTSAKFVAPLLRPSAAPKASTTASVSSQASSAAGKQDSSEVPPRYFKVSAGVFLFVYARDTGGSCPLGAVLLTAAHVQREQVCNISNDSSFFFPSNNEALCYL